MCRDEIQSPACSARVQKIMEYASSDIRFDVPLAEACFEDRQEFCGNVPPGSARVIRCLQDRCPPAGPSLLLSLALYTVVSSPLGESCTDKDDEMPTRPSIAGTHK